jgi:hypothetical protein
MNGTGPNLGQTQLQSGLDQSIRAQMAAANSMRGGPLAQATAQRQAMLAGNQQRAQAVNQAAQLQQQQQFLGAQGLANAANAYGGLAGAMRGYDQTQANADLAAQLQARGQNYDLGGQLYGYGMGAAAADQAGRMGYETAQRQADYSTQVANANLEQGQGAQDMSLAGNIFGAVTGGVGGLASAFIGNHNGSK